MRYVEMVAGDTTEPLARHVNTAQAAVNTAAEAAGVHIRELLGIGDLSDACALINRTWASGGQDPLITPSLLRALTHVGNYAAGAYAGDRLVGAAIGFRGDRGAGQELHSHINTVAPGLRNRSVGFALKLHQRSWALRREISTITWTFDPLVSRNAFFNIAKLGARPAAYLSDFYGTMTDAVNAGDDSDRLLVEWRLTEPGVVRACAGGVESWNAVDLLAGGWSIALDENPQGLPVVGDASARLLLVKIPVDIEVIRRAKSESASTWRQAVRGVLGTLMTEDASVVGFAREGWYMLERGVPGA